MFYKEYLCVDTDFIPVFTKENDTEHRNAWKSFIPHESIRKILVDMIAALSGERAENRKAMWMTGSYGTGKTYAAFLIKHLLEDDLDEVKSWFVKYEAVSGLWNEFEALRKSKSIIVPVFVSASSAVRSDNRLFMEIQSAVKEALKVKGFSHSEASSLYDLVIGELFNTESTFNFDAAFRKYPQFFPVGMTSESVRMHLRSTPGDTKLLMDVLHIMELENKYLIKGAEDMKKWLNEIIRANNLDAIVFIWDEFTDYFRNNSAVSSLQELAHAASNMPFFLFLITHKDLDHFTAMDSDARKVLKNRFYMHNLTMNDTTSYRLMGNAIIPVENNREKWEIAKISLWDKVRQAYREIIDAMPGNTSLHEKEFEALVPMHPYTAFLLTMLSQSFSASQRTMFSFLCGEQLGGKRKNFSWFIKNEDTENWPYLTADYLWDYFFADENEDANERTAEKRNYYLNKQGNLNDVELRVFKVVMLLLLLDTEAKGIKIYRPLVKNVRIAFLGTPVYAKINQIIDDFGKQAIINVTGLADDRQMTLPMMSIDQARLTELIKRISSEKSFERCMVYGNDIYEAIRPLYSSNMPNRFSERYFIKLCSAITGNARNVLSEVQNRVLDKTYRIGVLLMLPKDDADIAKINQFIATESSRQENDHIVFINASEPVREEQWNEWINNKAREEYAKSTGDNNKKFYTDAALRILTGWVKKMTLVSKTATFGGEQQLLTDNISIYLDKIAQRIYGYGQEQLSTNDNLYKIAVGASIIKMGMGLDTGSRGAFEGLINVIIAEGVWENRDGLKQLKAHPLHRAFAAVQDIIRNNGTSPTSFTQIWETMQAPPFGYFPSAFSAFMIGYLLVGYTKGGYYLDDGKNTIQLSEDGLAKVVEDLLKNRGVAANYKLLAMDPKHITLCKHLARIFDLTEQQATTLQETRKYIRTKISESQYPLWIMEYSNAFEGQLNPNDFAKGVESIISFVKMTDSSQEILIADRLYDLMQHSRYSLQLKQLLTMDNMINGMNAFLLKIIPLTVDYLKGQGKSNLDIRSMAKDRTAESGAWLWEREKFNLEMGNWEKETQLVIVLNGLIPQQAIDLKDAYAQLRNLFGQYRLPLGLLEKVSIGNVDALRKLWRVVVKNQIEDPRDFATELKDQIPGLRAMLDGEVSMLQSYIQKEFNVNLSIENIRTQLYKQLQVNALDKDITIFKSEVDYIVQGMEAWQLFDQITQRWIDMSGYGTADLWSNAKKTPIEWMPVYKNCDFQSIIWLLRKKQPDALQKMTQLKTALDKNYDQWKAILDNQQTQDEAFIQHVVLNNHHMIGNYVTLDEIREHLIIKVTRRVNDWPDTVYLLIGEYNKLIATVFREKAMHAVKRKIDQMPPDTAKNYLKDLVESNATVGMAILDSNE